MQMIVFAGPSLRGAPRWRAAGVGLAGPARCGDILRAATLRPKAIGLVDGYFETTAAPWHKEILWALSEGIAMFGAASMGAVRAVEMAACGMIGIGWVYERYRDGLLEDEDEIALLHGPAETGYVPLTEALVNVRATLERCVFQGLIGRNEAEGIVIAAKATFYKDRTWPRILSDANMAGVREETLERVMAWLPDNALDRKALDADAMVEAMLAHSDSDLRGGERPRFVRTMFSEALHTRVRAEKAQHQWPPR